MVGYHTDTNNDAALKEHWKEHMLYIKDAVQQLLVLLLLLLLLP
jgi:hypothetical protein